MISILLYVAFFFKLCASGFSEASYPNWARIGNTLVRNTLNNESVPFIQELKYRIQKTGACNRTAICFALDGSGSISVAQYKNQIKFAETIASIIDVNPLTQFAAIQYGFRNVEISELTDKLDDFRTSLNSSESVRASRTFISAGIAGCAVKLRGNSTSIGDNPRSSEMQGERSMKNKQTPSEIRERKVVLLGDGRDNFGISPLKVASKIKEALGADLFAIGIGFPDVGELKDIVGDFDKLSVLSGYGDLELKKIVSDVISFTCGIDQK